MALLKLTLFSFFQSFSLGKRKERKIRGQGQPKTEKKRATQQLTKTSATEELSRTVTGRRLKSLEVLPPS
ncbi:hypothetical protein IC582_026365 [Cucumis melo]